MAAQDFLTIRVTKPPFQFPLEDAERSRVIRLPPELVPLPEPDEPFGLLIVRDWLIENQPNQWAENMLEWTAWEWRQPLRFRLDWCRKGMWVHAKTGGVWRKGEIKEVCGGIVVVETRIGDQNFAWWHLRRREKKTPRPPPYRSYCRAANCYLAMALVP